MSTSGQSQHRRLKIVSTILAFVLVAVIILPIIARPQEARAFPGEAMAAAVWRFIKDKIESAVTIARKGAADLAFKNALKVYLTKFAEDTAIWLASAGTGQKPLFVTDPNYFTKLTDAAAGDFLDTLATNTFGINICAPIDPRTQFKIELAVRALVDPANFCQNQCQRNYEISLSSDTFLVGQGILAEPRTMTLPQAEEGLGYLRSLIGQGRDPGEVGPFSIFRSLADITVLCYAPATLGECLSAYESDIPRYKQTAEQDFRLCMNLCSANKRVARCTAQQAFANYQDLQARDFLPKITAYFEPGENSIGQIMTLTERAEQAARLAREQEEAARLGILPLRDPVTGAVKTPPEITEATAEEGLTKDPSGSAFGVYTGSPIADAIGVFTNTLTRQLLKRIFERGFNPASEPSVAFTGGEVAGFGGAEAARTLFASLQETQFTSGGTSATLADLASCPETGAGPNNCVIEENFRQAIEQGLTVKEALDSGLLRAEWPVGFRFEGDPNQGPGTNVEPDFRDGYPYRSLLVLRRLRILPIGWELAALFFRDFDERGGLKRNLGSLIEAYDDCNEPTISPFCGLVDPHWVLKAPANFCEVSGATTTLTSLDYFPDPLFPDAPQVQQIGRAEACVDEKTCVEEDEQGNCRAFGYCIQERASWKFGGEQCDAFFNSCENFAKTDGTEFAFLETTVDREGCAATNAGCQWYCQDFDSRAGIFTCSVDTGNKDHFTGTVRTCPADAKGCNEYIRTVNNSNLLANGGFETLASGDAVDDGNPDTFPGWVAAGFPVSAVTPANQGAAAALINTGGSEMRVSFTTGSPLAGQAYTLTFYGRAISGSCGGALGLRSKLAGVGDFVASDPLTMTPGWQRFTKTIIYDPAFTYADTVVNVFITTAGCDAVIDDVQLEFGENFSQYKDYGEINTVYLNDQRFSCRPEEVGCDLYSSATDQIPGVATAADFCPKDLVGCRAFLEVPVTANGADPNHPVRTGLRCSNDQSISCLNDGDCGGGSCLPTVSLLPATGESCSAASVGCEEYTNLDEVAKGGEGKEYYTYIRPCAKPPDGQKTFYTWIGSEEIGFQLKAYNLQQTGTLYSDDTAGGGPNYITGTDDTLCSEAIFSDPSDARWSPDCRQFYDAGLSVYYRLYSKTISVSADCHPLRNTIDAQIYNTIPSEGITCPASEVQCREYRGPSGFNTRQLLSDNFDDGDTAGWDGGTPSTESLIFGGGSMLVSGSAVQTNATLDIPSRLEAGRSYIVTFWAGAASAGGPYDIEASFGGAERFRGLAQVRWDSAVSGPEWNFYTLGPLHLDREPDPADHLKFSGTGSFFLDNVKLLELADNLFMIKDSFGLCTGNENCDRYTNRDGKEFFLKSFTRLCSTDKVGCEALINTYNSNFPFEQTFENGTNADGSEPKFVPADTVELIVNDPKKSCSAEFQGCRLLGKPTLGPAGRSCSNNPTQRCSVDPDCGIGNTCQSQDVTIEKYDGVFLIDDPDEYRTILCRSAEAGCEAWKNTRTGEISYFRDPAARTCEYKTVKIGDQTFSAWYKQGKSGLGATDACPVIDPAPDPADGYFPVVPYTQPTGVCENNPATTCVLDADCVPVGGGECVKWVGTCPVEQAGCKEYRDVSDPEGCFAQCLLTEDQNSGNLVPVNDGCAVDAASTTNGCRGYWYLEQTVEDDARQCNNAVSEELGCRAFFSPETL